MYTYERFFNNEDILGNRLSMAKSYVVSLPENKVIDPIEDQIINGVVDIYKAAEIYLYVERKEIVKKNPEFIEIAVPFEGSRDLFEYRSSTYAFNSPMAKLEVSEIWIRVDIRGKSKEDIESDIETQLNSINKWLDWVNVDVRSFNKNLENSIRELVQARMRDIKQRNDVINSLGLPLRS